MNTFPALDVRTGSTDLLLAIVDDFMPTAVEDGDGTTRIFFARAADRDAALAALAPRFQTSSIDVPDEDWARRSQADLQPITVGHLTVFPNRQFAISHQQSAIVIPPSMAFGTGHHATTALCLEALQSIDLVGACVLDVGTGSGILAIAAVRLGARRAHGIDTDKDAIQTARENLARNPGVAASVTFDVGDVSAADPARGFAANVVTANLTGALLMRAAPRLLTAVPSGGTLVLSGIQAAERDEVVRAFAGCAVACERVVDEWVCLLLKKP